MREAKTSLNNAVFEASHVRAHNEDITRTELVATALKLEIVADSQDDEVPPSSFFLAKSDVRTNLAIMVCVWLFTVFNSFLLSF